MSECTNCDLVTTGKALCTCPMQVEYICKSCDKLSYVRAEPIPTLTLEKYKDLYNKGLLDEKD